MARYPSVVKSRINVDLKPLASGLAGGPEEVQNPASSAQGETTDELAQTQAEKAGQQYAPSQPNYPHYKQPGFWSRALNPEGAANIDRMNNASSMAEANNAASLNSAQKLAEFNANLNSFVTKAVRDGHMTPDEAKQFRDSYVGEQLNSQQANNLLTGSRRQLLEQEPEVGYASEKAKLMRPGVENRQIESTTQAQNIKNEFLPQREPAEIENLKAHSSYLGQETQQKGLLFPFEQEKAKNAAIGSGIIRVPANEVVGNLPSSISNRPINWFSVTPEQKEIQGGLQMQPDPKDPSKMAPIFQPTKPSQAPFMSPLGTLNNLQRPTSGTEQTGTSTTDPYEYRTDPTTGKMQRRPRNPSLITR